MSLPGLAICSSGALSVDDAFKDDNGKPGFDMANRQWPHGVVFSR
jgi:hypothetical protein